MEDGTTAGKTTIRKGILKSGEKEKRIKRSVSFNDSIGKPLVEYFIFQPDEENEDDHVKYEKTKGKYITMQEEPPENINWKIIEVVAPNRKIIKQIESKSFLIEENRKIAQNVSSAPLFGTFEMIEDQNLGREAEEMAKRPIPVIPCDPIKATSSSTAQLKELPLPGKTSTCFVYEQLSGHDGDHEYIAQGPSSFENDNEQGTTPQINSYVASTMTTSSDGSTTTTTATNEKELSPALRNMLEQLRKRGFMENPLKAAENCSEPAYPIQGAATMSKNEGAQNMNWKINEHCTYFMHRPNGCSRGDGCRFLHDEQKKFLQIESMEKVSSKASSTKLSRKDENWRKPSKSFGNGRQFENRNNRGRRNYGRSRGFSGTRFRSRSPR